MPQKFKRKALTVRKLINAQKRLTVIPVPSSPPTSTVRYKRLLKSIKATLARGLMAAQRALEYQRLKTYWDIGRQLNAAQASSNGAVVLNRSLYALISDEISKEFDLNVTADAIGRMVQLHKQYPVFPKKTTLTFTHYLALMRIADTSTRGRLEQKAVRQNFSAQDIKRAITLLKAKTFRSRPGSASGPLKFERGEPFVYRLISFDNLYEKEGLRIDCGFKMDVPLKGMVVQKKISSTIDKHRGIRVIKKGDRYHVQSHIYAYSKLYTYPANVTNVVDLDTIDVRIDAGFGIKLNDRLRFKGINGPELSTPEGQRGKAFLVDYLSRCPIIVLRTYKEGMYGRWITDIFAIQGCNDPYRIAAEGEYLNQLLLDKGWAVKY